MTIAESLRMLRDVEGVHGSFVVSTNGELVDSDLPAVFDGHLLGEVDGKTVSGVQVSGVLPADPPARGARLLAALDR